MTSRDRGKISKYLRHHKSQLNISTVQTVNLRYLLRLNLRSLGGSL